MFRVVSSSHALRRGSNAILKTNSLVAFGPHSSVSPLSRVFPLRTPWISRSFSANATQTTETTSDLPTTTPESDQSLGRSLKPREIVEQLNRFIIGQNDAKRAVAIALRNRWRRHQLDPQLRQEVVPKNILMIGPTGCGKTEIARRLAKLAQAPFIKVEATKFTEVGFHGRDVDMIIRDLVDISIQQTKQRLQQRMRAEMEKVTEERLLDYLTGLDPAAKERETFKELLRSGALEDREIQLDVPERKSVGGIFEGGSVSSDRVDPETVSTLLKRAMGVQRTQRRKMTIAEARPMLLDLESEKMVNQDEVIREAIHSVENDGIVFIDEIDKICSRPGDIRSSADASSEGVQRDLLPLIEGSVINTKHGNVNTDHILFIASGAFHSCKPSDLLPELQGRLPIRVELKALTESDLCRVLREPENNLIKQQTELLKTEQVNLEFTDDAIQELAKIAYEVNTTVENIGARRLHTVVEKTVETFSFDASDMAPNSSVTVDAAKVRELVAPLLSKTDLTRFIL